MTANHLRFVIQMDKRDMGYHVMAHWRRVDVQIMKLRESGEHGNQL